VWKGPYLFLALYAADEDIRSRGGEGSEASPEGDCGVDAFRLTLSRGEAQYVMDVSPRGIERESMRAAPDAPPRAWTSGAHVGFERDGTLDDPEDTDEEWMVEMALPRSTRSGCVGSRARRSACASVVAIGPTVCAGWGDEDVSRRIVLQ
jgi:hypothetical protein